MNKSQKFVENNIDILNVEHFIKTLTNCCSAACQIIYQSSKKATEISYKTQSDPVTQIDHTIQKLITEALDKEFKEVSVVGEQHIDQVMVDYKILEQLAQKSQKQHNIKFNQDLLKKISNQNHQIKKEDVCVFIDPLDCTRGYICGKKWECTVLIGITVKGEPVLGLIGQPFKRINEKQSHYEPSFILGGTLLKQHACYQYTYTQSLWTKIYNKNVQSKVGPKVAVSCRRSNHAQFSLLNFLGAKRIACGGSGNKLAMLIKGEVDAVIFVQSPLSTWDSCAGQAIILALQGILTKPNNMKIVYDCQNKNQTNERGYIGCLDKQFHNKIITYLGA